MEEKKENKEIDIMKRVKEALKGQVTGFQTIVEVEKLVHQYNRLKESRAKMQLQKELDDVRNLMEKESMGMEMPMPQQQGPQLPLQPPVNWLSAA